MKNTSQKIANRQSPTDNNFELVFGRNPVLELLKNGKVQVNKIWISENLQDKNLKERAVSYAK